MEADMPLRNKTIEDLNLDRYIENENIENPYYRKFGPKVKSYFSQVA